MKEMLKEAEKRIDAAMEKHGFINDSDGKRFIVALAQALLNSEDGENSEEDVRRFVLQIESEIMPKYRKIESVFKNDYVGYFYKADYTLTSWDEFNRYFKKGEKEEG